MAGFPSPMPLAPVAGTLKLSAPSPQSGLPNVTLTSQDNATVNVLQLGVDTIAANLKGQHITAQRPTDQGVASEMTINPGHSTGTDQAGAGMRIGDGISTGAGLGGGIGFILAPSGQPTGQNQNIQTGRFAMADVSGLSCFYPQILNNGFLGLSSNPWFAAYITTLNAGGGIGLWGHAPPAVQPAAPVTLADVIAIIRGCGLSA